MPHQDVTLDAELAAVEEAREHLQRGALSLVDGTIIGVASAAPAYSMTATVAILAGAIGFFYIFVQAARQFGRASDLIGIGLIVVGIPLLLWSYLANPSFYHQRTVTAEPEALMGPAAATGAQVTP